MFVAELKKMCKQRELSSMDMADSPLKNTCKKYCLMKKQAVCSYRRRNTLESWRRCMFMTDFTNIFFQLRTFRQFLTILHYLVHKARNVNKQIKFFFIIFPLLLGSVSALPKLCSGKI